MDEITEEFVLKRSLYHRVYRSLYHRVYRRTMLRREKMIVAFDEMRALREQTPSYRSSMKRERNREILSSRGPAKRLESKEIGVDFAALLNVPTLCPEVCPDVESVLHTLRASTTPQVVKPLVSHSSRDAFIFFTSEDIFEIGPNGQFGDIHSLESRLNARDRKGWLVEPFLASTNDHRCPAHDLKFYSFYGQIGLVLEVRRYPDVRFCWWDVNGKNIGQAKNNQRLFCGDGFSDCELEWAMKLSAEVPTPFIRVDFLKSSHGAYFGEFTPVPGAFEKFPYEIDAYLGRLYLEAEARLLKDLWDGKRFDTFRKVTAKQ